MTEYTAAKDALLMYVANAAMAIPHNLEYRAAHVDCSKMIGLIMAAQSTTQQKPSTLDQHQECYNQWRSGVEPKPSASTLPQRLRANSYNAPTWNDCDVMREAAHALENKDAEIAAVIRDNDAKLVEIERLNERIKCLKDSDRLNNEAIDRKNRAADRMGDEIVAKDAEIERLNTLVSGLTRIFDQKNAEIEALRNPDIEAAAKRAQKVAALQDECARVIARAILTREPG